MTWLHASSRVHGSPSSQAAPSFGSLTQSPPRQCSTVQGRPSSHASSVVHGEHRLSFASCWPSQSLSFPSEQVASSWPLAPSTPAGETSGSSSSQSAPPQATEATPSSSSSSSAPHPSVTQYGSSHRNPPAQPSS